MRTIYHIKRDSSRKKSGRAALAFCLLLFYDMYELNSGGGAVRMILLKNPKPQRGRK